MADIQVSTWAYFGIISGIGLIVILDCLISVLTYVLLYFRPKKLSKSKLEFSKTTRKFLPKRLQLVQDTTRRLVSVSRHHRPQLKDTTLITNAHSPPIFQSEAESSRVSFFQPRWRTLLHLEEITCITSKNTTDSRRDITTYQLTWPQLSAEPELEISSLSVNADQSPRLLDSAL